MINFVMNLIWDILGGLVGAILWCIFGVLWCCTIIGIPLGLLCFKMAGLVLWPFGSEIVYDGKGFSILVDVLWILFTGLELAAFHFAVGIVLCITIIGIPFGIQHFKMGIIGLLPCGSKVVR